MSEAVPGASADNVYDVIVIGAGPVGLNVADRSRAGGLSVAVVERELVGGECAYWGCVPSKALLRPVIAVADARRVDGAREAVTGPLDRPGVFGRRNRYVSDWDDSGEVEKHVTGIGADLVRGHGRLDGPRRVAVITPDDRLVVLAARHAVAICTGSRAALPDIPGIAEARPWTNRMATDSSDVPQRLAIVGGGPVGVEMATAWQGLGAATTLLAREAWLLPRMEPFAGEMVALGLKEAGAEVRTGVTVTELHRPGGTGPVTLRLDDGTEVEADEVLVAIGREPRTGDIGLETVGLTPGSWLDVNESCQVRALDEGWLYAVGDVNHRALLTHQGKYQARIVGNAISARAGGRALDTSAWGAHATTADFHAIPQVIFTDPEVASVGLTEEKAKAQNVPIKVGRFPFRALARATAAGDPNGFIKVLWHDETGALVGAHLIGPAVTDLIAELTLAKTTEVNAESLIYTIHAHPTFAEAIRIASEDAYGIAVDL